MRFTLHVRGVELLIRLRRKPAAPDIVLVPDEAAYRALAETFEYL